MIWRDAQTLLKNIQQRAKGGKAISLSMLEEESLKHAAMAIEHQIHHPWRPQNECVCGSRGECSCGKSQE